MSRQLEDRLALGLKLWQARPDSVVVVYGGQGINEPVTEAAAMKEYLTAHGVPERSILMETQSKNTLENIRLSKAMLGSIRKVAVVTGMPYPSNLNYQFGFMGGVQYANAKYGTAVACVEIPSFSGGDGVGGNYVGAFDDEATGKVVAETLIAEGCDVLFAAAGQSGNGVLTAVKEANGIWFIGCDVDQYDDGKKGDGNVVLTSSLKVMHLDVQRQLEAIYDGTFAGQDALLGADTDSTGYVAAEGRQQLSEDAQAKLAECYELIKATELNIRTETRSLLPQEGAFLFH